MCFPRLRKAEDEAKAKAEEADKSVKFMLEEAKRAGEKITAEAVQIRRDVEMYKDALRFCNPIRQENSPTHVSYTHICILFLWSGID